MMEEGTQRRQHCSTDFQEEPTITLFKSGKHKHLEKGFLNRSPWEGPKDDSHGGPRGTDDRAEGALRENYQVRGL